MQVFGCALAIVSLGLATGGTPAAGRHTDRQRQRIHGLDGGVGLPTDVREALLDGRYELPHIGGLPPKEGAVFQGWKAMAVLGAKVWPKVLVCGQFEVCATDFYGDDFLIRERRVKAAAPQSGRALEGVIVLASRQDTVMIKSSRSIGRLLERIVEVAPLFYEGSTQGITCLRVAH
jgi:hypothetical protein